MKLIAKKRQIRNRQAGISLLETVVALGILLVASIGVLSMVAISITTTENQGHLAARTAEYAQDKMEQLLALAFTDTNSDLTVASLTPSTSGGVGLTAGGNTTYGSASGSYVDYLDANGNPLGGGSTVPSGWFYVRQWKVTDLSSTLKQIDVAVYARTAVNGTSSLPKSYVTALKSNPF